MLITEDIERFQTLYRDQFGEDISGEQAREEAHALIGLLETLAEVERGVGGAGVDTERPA